MQSKAINYKEKVNKNMNCPECDAALNIPEDAAVGEIISCPDCELTMEIAKKDGSNVELNKQKA